MFNRRSRTLFFLRRAAVAAGVLVLSGGAIAFLGEKVTGISNVIVENRRLSAMLTERNETLAALAREYRTVAIHEPLVRASVPPADNVTEFTDALESIGKQYGVAQSVHFDAPRKTDVTLGNPPVAIVTIGFTISLSSNMFIFTEYLGALERLPYLIHIDSLTLSAHNEKGWSDTSSIVLHGTLTTQLPEEPLQ